MYLLNCNVVSHNIFNRVCLQNGLTDIIFNLNYNLFSIYLYEWITYITNTNDISLISRNTYQLLLFGVFI